MFLKYSKQIIDKFGNISSLKKTLGDKVKNEVKGYSLDTFLKSKKVLVIFFMLGVVALYLDFAKSKSTVKTDVTSAAQIDTFIPEGFVLVPIEIQNYDSLDALMGDFAMVDLFATHNQNKSKKLLENAKLIRAPLNPKQFAILVSEDVASNIMKVDPPYFVILLNPTAKQNVNTKKQTKNKIIYEDRL